MQLHLDFEPGLTERYPSLLDAVRAQIYGSGKPLKSVASDLDCSQSDLSRKLASNPDDTRRFSIEDLERLMPATESVLVIHWLIEKFLESADSRRDRAITEIQKQLPQFMALLKAATESGK